MTGPTVATSQGPRYSLGRRIRVLRESRELTIRALAELLQVSPATVSAIESGRTGVSAQRIARLADILGVPVQQLFDSELRPRRGTSQGRLAAASQHRGPAGPHGGDWRRFTPLDMDPALRGALGSFVAYGYHGATMRAIAERANLSVAGIYHYYQSKQDILVALLDLTMDDLLTRSAAAREQGRDPVERFTLLVECLALVHTHRRELAFVGASEMRSLAPVHRHRVAALRIEQQRMIDKEVADGVAAGLFTTSRPHEAARAVVTLCTALPQWFREDGPASAEEVAKQYVEFALSLVGFSAGSRRDR